MICVYKKALFITNAFEVHIICKLSILKMYTIYTYYIFICMCNLIKKLLVEPCPNLLRNLALSCFSTNLAIEVPPLLLQRKKNDFISHKSSPFVCNTGRDRFGLGSGGWIQTSHQTAPARTHPRNNCMPWHLPLG